MRKIYHTVEELRLANNAKRREYVERNKEVVYAKNREAKKVRLAAKAIAEGRTPGLVGNPVRYSREEQLESGRQRTKRWKLENLEANREADRRRRKDYLAKKAIADGRKPGIRGRARRLSDEERRARARANVQAGRAKRKLAPGRHSSADIRWLLEAQKGNCPFCLKPLKGKFHVDHYVPLVLGGTNDRANLRLLHPKCNLSKGKKHPVDHALRYGFLCW